MARFYGHRALRLFPALVVFCLVLLAAGTVWPPVVAALGHYANYARIAGLDLGLLTHAWFLAVMGHFYLLRPLAMAVTPARRRAAAVALVALAAMVWRVIAIGVMPEAWVYNATDTNAAALLAGCYLGVARPGGWRWGGWSLPVLLVLMLLPAFGEDGSAFLWGDFVPIALGVLAVQYAVSRPRWLEAGLVVWVGQISYGLYLWHYLFLRIGLPVWVGLPAGLAAAVASLYLVERPVGRWRRRRAKRRDERKSGFGGGA